VDTKKSLDANGVFVEEEMMRNVFIWVVATQILFFIFIPKPGEMLQFD